MNKLMPKPKKLKVLLIARKFPPSVGGMERFAFDLSTALAQKVDLRTITWGGSNLWLPIILPYFTIRGAWTLLFHRDIGIIHMQDAVQAPIGWLLHVVFRKPYIVVAHGLDITYTLPLYQWIILPFVRRADAVISISTATKDEAEARGVPKANSSVITLGTTDDYGSPKPDRKALAAAINVDLTGRKLLLTTGRLVKRKGVAWFIAHVLPKIAEEDEAVLYLVAGDGSEKEAIEHAITRAGMERHVKMLGRVSDDVRSLLYQSCDVFVMPNIIVPGDMEGFGIVAHEAATAGIPVVASNLEGIADALTDGENGILVTPKDARAYQAEILKLIADKRLRDSVGKRARQYTLKQFSWEVIARKYVDIYKKTIKR